MRGSASRRRGAARGRRAHERPGHGDFPRRDPGEEGPTRARRSGGPADAARPRSSLVAIFIVSDVLGRTDPRVPRRSDPSSKGSQRQAGATGANRTTSSSERIADLNDPPTLERLARECLGMVKPGEIAFVPIPKGRAPTPPDCG